MVSHCRRTASGNSLIHDRTGVRSDDVTTHPPQRTRPDKAGFAAFWPRRYAKGIPARAELLWEQEAGIPERIASARWPRDAGLVKWKTLLAQNEALGGSSPSPGTKTFFTYCAFSTKHLARKGKHGERPDVPDLMRVSQHPMVSQRFARGMPPRGQLFSRPMVTGSNPVLDLHVKVAQWQSTGFWFQRKKPGASIKMPTR